MCDTGEINEAPRPRSAHVAEIKGEIDSALRIHQCREIFSFNFQRNNVLLSRTGQQGALAYLGEVSTVHVAVHGGNDGH